MFKRLRRLRAQAKLDGLNELLDVLQTELNQHTQALKRLEAHRLEQLEKLKECLERKATLTSERARFEISSLYLEKANERIDLSDQMKAARTELQKLHEAIKLLSPGIYQSQSLLNQDLLRIEALRNDASHAFRNTGKQTSNGASFIFAEIDAMARNVNRNAYLEDRLRERANEMSMYFDYESDLADDLEEIDEEMAGLMRQVDDLGGLMEVSLDNGNESSYLDEIRKCEQIEEQCIRALNNLGAKILEAETEIAHFETRVQKVLGAVMGITARISQLG